MTSLRLLNIIKMESIRTELSLFNFSGQKPCTRIISSFMTALFEGYKCKKLYELTPKKRFLFRIINGFEFIEGGPNQQPGIFFKSCVTYPKVDFFEH